MLRELLNTLHANQLVIIAKLDQLLTQETKMAVDLTALTAEVANNTTVDGSIVTLLDNIVTQLQAIEAGSGDAATQTALNALVATLQNNDSGIAAAVVANTPAAPAASAAKPAS
jgi:C4-dicarboxylate transporter